MAQKIVEKRILEANGLLDINDDDQLVISVEGKEYNLIDILKERVGREISIKLVEV